MNKNTTQIKAALKHSVIESGVLQQASRPPRNFD